MRAVLRPLRDDWEVPRQEARLDACCHRRACIEGARALPRRVVAVASVFLSAVPARLDLGGGACRCWCGGGSSLTSTDDDFVVVVAELFCIFGVTL